MTQWYLGTMGFGYKDWSGVFYPPGLPSRQYLSHYSKVFNVAETDTSFYGAPREEVLLRWAAITPEHFKFCAKTPQEITHAENLLDGMDIMHRFLSRYELLGDRLGVVLLQFPPSFTVDKVQMLADFLAAVREEHPSGKKLRISVEVRNLSWHSQSDKVSEIFRRYGVAWAATEYPGLPRRIYLTADFLYIRWIGQHGAYDSHTYERIDRSPELKQWWELIRQHLDRLEAVYGFFNNDYAGFAPATCQKFKAIAGLPVVSFDLPQQGRLL
jgi:uncharacterized protein YecE (DUF72 family)